MLYAALTLSGIILVIVNLAALLSASGAVIASFCLLFLALVFSGLVALPPVVLQAVLLCIVCSYWAWSGRGWWRFLGLSSAVTVVVYAVIMAWVYYNMPDYSRLRQQFPYQSMDEICRRLPQTEDGPKFDSHYLNRLENDLDEIRQPRSYYLRRLHEETVDNFANSPGFGVMRMVRGNVTEKNFTDGIRSNVLLPQPGSILPSGSVVEATTIPAKENLAPLHDSGVLDFVHPHGFGYFKDRQHVAGFQSHGFSKVPASTATTWGVNRLDLISLIRHPSPAVYVSDSLPQMDALRNVPTRPLDAFEAEGLADLKTGKDLYVRGERMIGSVRSVKQCLDCHGGSRGDLLGAFSYVLRPAVR